MKLIDLQQDMRRALGSSLDTWGNVEASLCSIFCATFDKKEYEIGSAAFSAILSFEVQTAVTTAAIEERFKADKGILSAWKPRLKELNRLRPIRNRLAHGKMIIVRVKKTKGHEPRFLPFFHYYTHKDRRDFTHLNIPEIDAYRIEFGALTKELEKFGKLIGASFTMRQADWYV